MTDARARDWIVAALCATLAAFGAFLLPLLIPQMLQAKVRQAMVVEDSGFLGDRNIPAALSGRR